MTTILAVDIVVYFTLRSGHHVTLSHCSWLSLIKVKTRMCRTYANICAAAMNFLERLVTFKRFNFALLQYGTHVYTWTSSFFFMLYYSEHPMWTWILILLSFVVTYLYEKAKRTSPGFVDTNDPELHVGKV